MILDHLWQSTLCVALAALVAAALRNYPAHVRHRVWLVASLKFLMPFSVLIAAGRSIPVTAPAEITAVDVSAAVRAIGEPFSEWRITHTIPDAGTSGAHGTWLFPVLLLAWATGSSVVLWSRCVRWRRLAAIVREARPMGHGREPDALRRAQSALQITRRVDLLSSPVPLEPGVVGLFNPSVVWPDGLSNRLSDRQLDAIFVHELSHVRRLDNLTSAVHLLVESLFWFHPLVWWVGSRLVRERERACDEAVLRLGGEPHAYAESILKVCEYCLQSPLMSSAGAAGRYLKQRVEEIMSPRVVRSLTRGRQALLGAITCAVFISPIIVGAVSSDSGGRTARPSHPTPGADQAITPSTVPGADASMQGDAGRIVGTVTDSTGLVVPGATVTVTSVTTKSARSVVTDVAGKYAVTGLSAGPHNVQVRLSGFRATGGMLQVGAGAEAMFDAQLQIGGLTETITVVAPAMVEPPAVGPTRTRVGGDIQAPRKIRDVKPIYPTAAIASRETGIVIIEATIATDGTVKDARILRSVPIFDDAALAAVREWLFTPTLLNGAPVEVVMTVTVNFEAR